MSLIGLTGAVARTAGDGARIMLSYFTSPYLPPGGRERGKGGGRDRRI